MNQGSWPDAVTFDPGSGAAARVWEDTLATAVDRPPVLLLISGQVAQDSSWSASVAIELADTLAAHRACILADLHFDKPELHGLVATADAEGVADAILFGASLDRVTLASDQHRFELIPAAGPVADTAALLRDSAWVRLIDEARRRGSALLLYAPWQAPGMEGLVSRVDGAIMLGGQTDARLASRYLPAALPVLAVLSPPLPRPVSPAARAIPAPAARPVVPSQQTSSRRWLRVALPVMLLMGAGGGIAAVLFQQGSEPEDIVAPPVEAPAETTTPGAPAGTPLPFAVAIEAHQDLPTASRRVEMLRSAEPEMGFFLAPVLVDSVVYHRVLAGPTPDSGSAAVLMQQLITRGHKTGGSEWDIRNAPMAFEVGVFDTREDAQARVDHLAGDTIPAYVLEVPYSSGADRYHVYAGAYAGPAEADVLRQVLAGAGMPANLVQRIGRPAS